MRLSSHHLLDALKIHTFLTFFVGKNVKSWEIIITVFLVMAGYITADAITNQLIYQGAVERFILRVGILIPYFLLVYLFFESRDISKRIRLIEQRQTKNADKNETNDQHITEGKQNE